ncbi:MAG: M23 family metallopeptidase [Hyphomicrobiaceae bacterium]|nr:M23 family metallopeptidase [Hyphomicrobiaceae bacterium]
MRDRAHKKSQRPVWVRAGQACILLTVASLGAEAADAPRLSLPLDCEPGRTCFVQNYVDVDPGPGVQDFACGKATYDGHDGVDFRVPSWRTDLAGTKVLAAAPGVVRGRRDGMPDRLLRDYGSTTPRSVLAGKECGNGLVIDHGNGWETQYCHMKRGSVAVTGGEKVERGTTLGEVGVSGQADFAHLHLSVRHNGKAIDPFTTSAQNGTCMSRPTTAIGLWDEPTAAALAHRTGQIIVAGIAGVQPDHNAIERGTLPAPLAPTSAAVVVFAMVMNIVDGDQVRLRLHGPQGEIVARTAEPSEKTRATRIEFAGKRLNSERWPTGRYTATAEVIRGGTVVESASETVDLR